MVCLSQTKQPLFFCPSRNRVTRFVFCFGCCFSQTNSLLCLILQPALIPMLPRYQKRSREHESHNSDYSILGTIHRSRKLPVYALRDSFLKAVEDHQVIVIIGETGCGKTTQIPRFLHEAGYTKAGKIGCTQPRRVASMTAAARVSQEMGVKLGHEVGYSVQFEDCTSDKTVLKYMTDDMLVRESLGEPDLRSYSVLMVDDAHERSLPTDILFSLVKNISQSRLDLKLLISSATMEALKLSNYFDDAPVFNFPRRRFSVRINHIKEPESDYLSTAITMVFKIHEGQPRGDGDILIFLPGKEEIETAEEELKKKMWGLGCSISELIVCPIYADLPIELQAKIFKRTPEGARKVVLATDIAETSLSINGIRYVIDSGLVKLRSYNPLTGIESVVITTISKASANLRARQSGLMGECLRLYTEYNLFKERDDDTLPEIQRSNLANALLSLKRLGIRDLVDFDFMDAPPVEALPKAQELLQALGALDTHGELTYVGRKMSEFPLDPLLSKMIVASDTYKCSHEIITIAAMLSVEGSVFHRPKDKEVEADNARFKFHTGNVGDHIALLKVYRAWKETSFSTKWCNENYIKIRSMERARVIRDHLKMLLGRVGINLTSNLHDLVAIKKAIISGYFPHLARMQMNGSYTTISHPQNVYIDPSSGLAQVLPRFVVYHELVLGQLLHMQQVIAIKPEWLMEVAPHYYTPEDVKGCMPSLPLVKII